MNIIKLNNLLRRVSDIRTTGTFRYTPATIANFDVTLVTCINNVKDDENYDNGYDGVFAHPADGAFFEINKQNTSVFCEFNSDVTRVLNELIKSPSQMQTNMINEMVLDGVYRNNIATVHNMDLIIVTATNNQPDTPMHDDSAGIDEIFFEVKYKGKTRRFDFASEAKNFMKAIIVPTGIKTR